VAAKAGAGAKDSGSKPAVDDKLIDHWQKRLGTKNVSIRTNSHGAGQVVIKFKSQEELDKIQKLLG
jgi:hypothetical protein